MKTVPAVERMLDALMDSGYRRLIVSMADVSFVDSAGMALIFRAIRRMRAAGGLLSLTDVQPRVMRALRIARVVDLVPVSAQGSRDVTELPATAQPRWRRVLKIDPDNLGATRGRVESLLDKMPFSNDDRFDMLLAIGEAMGNAVDHTDGYCCLVVFSCYDDRAVVEVTDCGCGLTVAPNEEVASECASEARGRGIKLMRLLADSVTIHAREGGTGTVVRLVKLIR